APRYDGAIEFGSQGGRDIIEAAFTQVAEDERRLPILHFRLHTPDLLFDVAISREDVQITIQVVVEKENTKSECQQTGPAYRGGRCFVHKQAGALVVIEPEHLIREIPH